MPYCTKSAFQSRTGLIDQRAWVTAGLLLAKKSYKGEAERRGILNFDPQGVTSAMGDERICIE